MVVVVVIMVVAVIVVMVVMPVVMVIMMMVMVIVIVVMMVVVMAETTKKSKLRLRFRSSLAKLVSIALGWISEAAIEVRSRFCVSCTKLMDQRPCEAGVGFLKADIILDLVSDVWDLIVVGGPPLATSEAAEVVTESSKVPFRIIFS